MAFRPYLAFAGECRAAFTRYQEILGGELTLMSTADAPPDAGAPASGANPDAVVHAALTRADGVLMGADDLSGSFEGNVRGMCVNCSLPDTAEAARVFDALCEGGQVQMPMGETFFAPAFGMCIDRFGVPWMVMVEPIPPS
ncbi:MAG TPA: VOC family protein [Acidimicrobiales bacterium]|nr:VOC family protein [Acidimicrobiales bacterium]